MAIEDGRLSSEDLGRIAGLKAATLKHDGLLEFWPPADNTHELGGFASLERWLDRARMGFSDQAAELNLTPPRGVLMVGVQGCGKSLAAKAIARRWQLPLLKLDAGRLYDKYIGETERNLRRAIATAESMAPAVLWIDEIEKAFATGGGGDTDGGLSRRVLGTFLTWLQEKKAPVFVVATANDLSILPPELLRKGRFDEIFFVDLPDAGERADIFAIHLRLRRQDPAAFDTRPPGGSQRGLLGRGDRAGGDRLAARCPARRASAGHRGRGSGAGGHGAAVGHARRGRGASARAGAGALRAGALTRARAMLASASRQRRDSSA